MLGSFANQNLVRFASFAKTGFAKIFSGISDWRKYLLKMLRRNGLSSSFAMYGKSVSMFGDRFANLVSKSQICTLAGCIPPLFF